MSIGHPLDGPGINVRSGCASGNTSALNVDQMRAGRAQVRAQGRNRSKPIGLEGPMFFEAPDDTMNLQSPSKPLIVGVKRGRPRHLHKLRGFSSFFNAFHQWKLLFLVFLDSPESRDTSCPVLSQKNPLLGENSSTGSRSVSLLRLHPSPILVLFLHFCKID